MRRPHVFERSAPRARRDVEHENGADCGPAARATVAAPAYAFAPELQP